MTNAADIIKARVNDGLMAEQRALDVQELSAEQRRAQEVAGMSDDEIRGAASAFLRRWGRDGTLPKGRPGDSGECVFARALGGTWDGMFWQLPTSMVEMGLGLPAEVREFISRFDRHQFPDLIDDGAPEMHCAVDNECKLSPEAEAAFLATAVEVD